MIKCDCCDRVLNKKQMKIEARIGNNSEQCYCSIAREIAKKNATILKFQKDNSEMLGFIMGEDLFGAFQEYNRENQDG